MAKRRHSVRRHKRVKTFRASFKRGGDNTHTDGRLATFYNTTTGKPTKTNVDFFDPAKISTKTGFTGIFGTSDKSKAEAFFDKKYVDERNRAAAIDDFNRLTEQYKNAIGGLKRRKTFKRKTSRRKSRRSK